MIKRSSALWRLSGIVAVVLVLAFAANAGKMLVVNHPERSDAILVLAGETNYRPQLGLRLLDEGYARQLVIDVPADERIYQYSEVQLARNFYGSLPEAALIRICPIYGLSTKAESHDIEKCLTPDEHRILIVTSDYHTQRAFHILRHELKDRLFSIAAAHDPREYGIKWWQQREWAKTCFDEWMKLLWWNTVDRWR